MANGDIAAAAGFTPVSGGADIRAGYDQINRLADWVAQRTAGVAPVAAGVASVTVAANGAVFDVTTTVLLPTGRFTSAPSVTANPNTGATNEMHIGIQAITAAQFTLYYERTNAASNVSIYWIAAQRG